MSEKPKFYTFDEILEMFPMTPEGEIRAKREREAYIASRNLKQIRKLRSVTQTALAALLQVSQNRISQIERGRIDSAQLGTLERYVEALGGQLTVSAKFGDETFVLSQSK